MINKSTQVAPTPKQWEDSSPQGGSKSSALGLGVDIRTSSKKIFIETYGCQMNVYDTELVRSILAKAEYVLVPTENEADIVLLNTCAIREHAHQKVYNRIHEIKRAHSNPVMIGILGCMATNLRTDLLETVGWILIL